MKVFYTIFMMMVLLVMVGCGPTETSKAPAATQSQDKQAEKTVQPKAEAKESNAIDKLKDALNAKMAARYTADYEITAPGMQMTQKWMIDGTKSVITTGTGEGISKMINDGSRVIMCTQPAGNWMCLASDIPKEKAPTDMTAEQVDDYKVVMEGPCSVAGEAGTRFSIESGSAETIKQCITSDGIPLEMTSSNYTMRATSVRRNVDASEFTPPAEVMTLDEYIASMTG